MILLMRGGVGGGLVKQNNMLLFSSFVIMSACTIGMRVVYSIPLTCVPTGSFALTEIRPAREYLAAARRPLFALAVGPVWFGSAVVFLSIWPLRQAAGHLVILWQWEVIVAYVSLQGFRKCPPLKIHALSKEDYERNGCQERDVEALFPRQVRTGEGDRLTERNRATRLFSSKRYLRLRSLDSACGAMG